MTAICAAPRTATPARGCPAWREPGDRRMSTVFHRQARLRGALPGAARVTTHLGDRSRFALTFDDGPHPRGTPAVVAALDRAGATATFFVLADAVRSDPAPLREVVAAGHGVGLHADRHERLDRTGTAELSRRLRDARQAVEDAIGRAVTLHRPPYGRLSLAGARAAHRAGLEVALWSEDPRDWDDAPDLAGRVAAACAPGAIVLLHDGAIDRHSAADATAQVLGPAIARARDRGLSPVGLGGR